MDYKFDTAYFGAGCFWNAERVYANQPGVIETEVGWCEFDDDQGRVEVVKVTYDQSLTDLEKLITPFWDSHNPNHGRNEDKKYVERSILLPTNDRQEEIMKKIISNKKSENGEIKTSLSRFSGYVKAPEKDQKYYLKN